MKRLALFLFVVALALMPETSFAYSSSICVTGGDNVCSETEVGPFMKDISVACGNSGDCTLNDILTVFVNVGNYVVGIIGVVVLLMYVIGGFYWLASAGRPEWVKKGKQYMTISTIGLLIVMFSSLAIYALKGALQKGTFAVEGEYYTCTGSETLGKACDVNSTCTEYGCESLCRQNDPNTTTGTDEVFTTLHYNDCIDIDTFPDTSTEGNPYKYGGCTPNLCPGDESVQCCQLEYYYIE